MTINSIFVENRAVTTTNDQYLAIAESCKQIFLEKYDDYGPSWMAFRPKSLTDQMIIKARRIRQLEGGRESKVGDGIADEYRALVNYGIMALLQMDHDLDPECPPDRSSIEKLYDEQMKKAYDLMQAKNHDYGEAWRDLRTSSMTDLILVKLLRIRRIEENEGATKVSEGIESNYLDIINYSIFALIILTENQDL